MVYNSNTFKRFPDPMHCDLHHSEPNSCRRQGYLHSLRRTAGNCHLLKPWQRVSALHTLELLHDAHNYVRRFCEGVLLADADTRATAEGKVFLSAFISKSFTL